jgi:hypothetical protein
MVTAILTLICLHVSPPALIPRANSGFSWLFLPNPNLFCHEGRNLFLFAVFVRKRSDENEYK